MRYLLSLLLLSACSITPPRPADPSNAMVFPGESVISKDEGIGTRDLGDDKHIIEYGKEADLVKERGVPAGTPVPYDPAKDACPELEKKGVTCDPNYEMKISLTPSDPMYGLQWAFKRMNSPKAWDTVNRTNIKVAILDTGLSPHPDLNQSIKGGYNAINNGGSYADDNGHSSHVSGTVCAYSNNSLGVSGTAWSCDLYGVKFLSASGSGSLFDAVKAVDWAISQGVRIINASFGGGGYSQSLYDAISRAEKANILFVAAAGNEGRNTDVVANYPSGYDLPNIISVGSIDKDGRLSYFSNFGNQSVDIVAPGGAILSTNNSNGYVVLSGTSMAAPAVSGVAALIWQQDPNQTYLEVKQKLFANAKPRPKMKVKYGELQADSFDSTPCDPKKLKKCYDSCKATFPNQTYKRRLCRRSCREQYQCEVGALTWAKEQLGLD